MHYLEVNDCVLSLDLLLFLVDQELNYFSGECAIYTEASGLYCHRVAIPKPIELNIVAKEPCPAEQTNPIQLNPPFSNTYHRGKDFTLELKHLLSIDQRSLKRHMEIIFLNEHASYVRSRLLVIFLFLYHINIGTI